MIEVPMALLIQASEGFDPFPMDDREVMIVLLYDEHETDQEFEARLLANLPNWVVGSLLWISEHRHRAVHAGLQLPQPWEVLPVEAILWSDQYALARR